MSAAENEPSPIGPLFKSVRNSPPHALTAAFAHNKRFKLDAATIETYPPLRALYDYIDFGATEYYYLSEYQYTVPRNNSGGYDGILAPKGICELLTIDKYLLRDEYAAYVREYYLVRVSSGRRSNLKKIMYGHSTPDEEYDNIVVVGVVASSKGCLSPVRTSIVVLYGAGWCRTLSGSLYKLGTETRPEIVDAYISTLYKTLAAKQNKHDG